MKSKIKVGVIGAGSIGQQHVRIYSALPEVELVGVADVNRDLVDKIGKKYNVSRYYNYNELLSQSLDAVSIAVPTSQHEEVAVRAIEKGCNILMEKPLAHNVSAAQRIIRAAHDKDVKLMVGHVERFNPVLRKLKEIVKEEIILIELTRVGPQPPRIKDVGVAIDLAIHDVDLVHYLSGSPFEKTFALINRENNKLEDAAVFIFKMKSGTLARVTCSWLTPFKIREINLSTKRRFFKGDLISQRLTEFSMFRNDSFRVREIPIKYQEPLEEEIKSFVNSLKSNSEVPIPGEEGLKALQVIESCFEKHLFESKYRQGVCREQKGE